MGKSRPLDVNPRTATRHLRLLMKKYDGICQFCLKKIPLGLATREHIKRLADGGAPGMSNLTLACKPCNSKNEEIQHLIARITVWIKECIERQAAGAPAVAIGSGSPNYMAPTYPELIRKGIQATIIRQTKGAPIAGGYLKYLNCSSTRTKKERDWC